MPIVIDRSSGEVRSFRTMTEEERQKAIEVIVKAYVKKNPEALSGKKSAS